jgi:dipeptidyl-peptidase 4
MRSHAVLLFFLLLISFSIQGQEVITNESIWKTGRLGTRSVPGFSFMKDGKSFSKLVNNSIVKFDLVTGQQTEVLFEASGGSELLGGSSIQGYTFSDNEARILLETDRNYQYRYSYFSKVYLYERKSGDLFLIDKEPVQLPTFSPDGSKIAYVKDNNLYIFTIATRKSVQITQDGQRNKIINGAPDWVYEEEFSFSKAYEWSSDGQRLAYIKFDETEVPEFNMHFYDSDQLYPIPYTFKYPKVGENNSVVSVHVYDLSTGSTVSLDATVDADQYIPRIQWTTVPNELVVTRLNRWQNHLELLLYQVDKSSPKPRLILEEKSKYYVEFPDRLFFSTKGDSFVWTSERGGYNDLYLYDKKGKLLRQLTEGVYDVTQVYGLDASRGWLYYQAASQSPTQREIFRVSLREDKIERISQREGTHQAQFSTTFDYWVDNFSTMNTPNHISIKDLEGNTLRVLEDNEASKAAMDHHKVSAVEFFTIDNGQGTQLNAWWIKPMNFDEAQSYPVLMYVYGGPGSQQVTDAWKGSNYWWFQSLAQQGYIVVCVDNRGTGARGEEFKKMTYLQLGKYETEDQIAAAEYLGTLPFVDKNRIGIWGWSYGGYMSSLCLLKGAHVFKAAIAVAPVTNWKWYDSIYTERYMRTLSTNAKGYEDNSPVNFAHLLQGNFLLIHGLGDDNVHAQHAIELSEALIRANKQFEMVLYPNRNHGIYGNNGRLHLYDKMTQFIREKL